MSIVIRSCPSCGQANPAASLFCPNCATSLSAVAPANAPSTTEESFFDVPAFLRDASRKRRRRHDPVGGAGWSWIGAILIAAPIAFSIDSPTAIGLWLGGISLATFGFWQLRRDRQQLAKAGVMTNLVALIALGAIIARLVESPDLQPNSANSIGMATAEPTAPPDWAGEDQVASPPRGDTLGTVAMFRGDPAHTGVHPGPGPVGHPTLQWRHDSGGELYSSPAVSGGVIYLGSKSGSLHAIDELTGEEQWQFDLNDYVIVRSSPAVVNRTVYIGGGYALYAVDAESGKEEWRFAMPYIGQSSPTVSGGVVYISSQEGHLYAVKAETGEELWHFQIDGLIFSSPAVANGMVFLGSDDGNLYGLKAETGKLVWKFPTGGGVFAAPAVVDGTVYVASKSRSIFALNARTGEERWRYSIGGESSPAVVNGLVFVGSDDGGLYALNATNGDVAWLFPTGAPITTSATVAGETVYVASGASLYAVDARDGAKRWNYATSDTIESSPTIVDGIVYIGSQDGFLYAIGGDGVTEDAPPATGSGDAINPVGGSGTAN